MVPDSTTPNHTIKSRLTVLITTPYMSTNPNFKAPVYAQNAAKARAATSNKTMMTTISIVANLVNSMSNAVPT